MAHHVREVSHHPAQVATVNVREETVVDGGVGPVFEGTASGLVEVLNGALTVQEKDWNVPRFVCFGSASKTNP
jgi:hypothetical protein